MRLRNISLCLSVLLMIGCSNEERAFQVSVQNKTSKPISMWTIKENGPDELQWVSPEQLAMMPNPPIDEKLPRQVIPPEALAVSQTPLVGEFDKLRGRAYLRIYEGTPTLSEMLAIDRGSMTRLDLLLQPGTNSFVIENKTGILAARHGLPSTRPTETPR